MTVIDESTALASNVNYRQLRSRNNLIVLVATCSAFMIFVIAELAGALISNSLALLGDAAAMFVDVFTYMTNIYAEILKARHEEMDERTHFILEVIVPGTSLCCLLLVTAYVTVESVHVLVFPNDDHDEVDIMYLYGFSALNVFIDVFSSIMFFVKPNDAATDIPFIVGIETTSTKQLASIIRRDSNSNIQNNSSERLGDYQVVPSSSSGKGTSDKNSSRKSYNSGGSDSSHIALEPAKRNNSMTMTRRINLNMVSAATHMIGDCLRTGSVIIAAMISSIEGVPRCVRCRTPF